jgi:hypothetical protein
MILENVEFLPPIFMPCFGSHFENGRHLENEFIPDNKKFLAVAIFKMAAKIQHCPIS